MRPAQRPQVARGHARSARLLNVSAASEASAAASKPASIWRMCASPRSSSRSAADGSATAANCIGPERWRPDHPAAPA